MEHLLVQGGGEYLPFARSRIKAMQAAGLGHAAKTFMFNGVSVSARISGDQSFIAIRSKKSGEPGSSKRWRRGNLSVVINRVLAAAERAIAAAGKAKTAALASACVTVKDGTITDGACQNAQVASEAGVTSARYTLVCGAVANASARAAQAHYLTGLASDAALKALDTAGIASVLATASSGAPDASSATAARSAAKSVRRAHVLTAAGREKAGSARAETDSLAVLGAAVVLLAPGNAYYSTFSMALHNALATNATAFDTAADYADTLAAEVVAMYEPDSGLLAKAPAAALATAAAALASKDAGAATKAAAEPALNLSKAIYQDFARNQYVSSPWVATLHADNIATSAKAAVHLASTVQPGGLAAGPAERPEQALENGRLATAAGVAAVLAATTALPVDLSADVLLAAYNLTALIDTVAYAEELPGDGRYAVWSIVQAGSAAKEAFNKSSAGARRLGVALPAGFFEDYKALVALAVEAAYTDAKVFSLCYSAIVEGLGGAQSDVAGVQTTAAVSQGRAVAVDLLIPGLRTRADELAKLIAAVPEDDAALVASYATLAGDAAEALGAAIAASAAFIPQAVALAVLFPPIYAQYLDAQSIADAAGA